MSRVQARSTFQGYSDQSLGTKENPWNIDHARTLRQERKGLARHPDYRVAATYRFDSTVDGALVLDLSHRRDARRPGSCHLASSRFVLCSTGRRFVATCPARRNQLA